MIIDPVEARRQRDLAIAQVDAGADPEWKAAAAWTVLYICLTQRVFTPDAMWAAGLPKPREPRALGPVMLRAARKGLCRKTGRIVPSQIPSQHQNPINEWVSLIYDEGVTSTQWDDVPPSTDQVYEQLSLDDR